MKRGSCLEFDYFWRSKAQNMRNSALGTVCSFGGNAPFYTAIILWKLDKATWIVSMLSTRIQFRLFRYKHGSDMDSGRNSFTKSKGAKPRVYTSEGDNLSGEGTAPGPTTHAGKAVKPLIWANFNESAPSLVMQKHGSHRKNMMEIHNKRIKHRI